MSEVSALPLAPEWKERLSLANRHAPEFYETADAVVDTPHALAIRTALDELGLSGIFCVQGVPTIALLNVAQFDTASVVNIHGALWNQGLASLLLVTAGDTLRAYSLARTPQREWGHEFDQRCLIEALNATADALKICNIVYGAESGRLWKEHADVPQRRSTTPGAGRDRPGGSTATTLKRKKPPPPAIQHTSSAGAIPSAGRIRQPLAKG